MSKQQVIIFVKAPRPGAVKTRLAQAIGAEQACIAYQSLVRAVLGNLRACDAVELRFAPDDALPEIVPWLQPAWVAKPQGDGDLGGRLARAFQDAFGSGAERVVVIGSDCPEVTMEDLAAAFHALDRADVVLGPAEDGGYWLIGLKQFARSLFDRISWSTARVLEQTVERIREAGLRVNFLRTLHDVDTGADWDRWQSQRNAQDKQPPGRC
jgi:rSAM/selenodomain-associated transferase 1